MSNFDIWLSPPDLSGNERKYVNDVFDSNWIAPAGPHIKKFEKMGEAGDKIMEEVLALFEKSPELKKKYSLVFRAFEQMSNKKAMKAIGF